MRRKILYSVLLLGLFLLPISGLTMASPFIFNSTEGTLEVNWANPVGLKFVHLEEGDRLDLTYSSTINVSIYFLRRERANEFRSPSFYKDQLPEPMISGRSGSIKIEVEDEGDYEILFLPEEASNTFKVEYSLKRSLQREILVYSLSAIGMLLTSAILIVLVIVLLKRANNEVMNK